MKVFFDTTMFKRSIYALSVPVLALVLGFGVAGAAPQDKTTICHYDKDLGIYKQISVSNNSVEAHMDRHGDKNFDDEGCSSYNWKLTQTLEVDSQDVDGVLSDALEADEEYKFVASGTYQYANWSVDAKADARSSYRTASDPLGLTIGWLDGASLPAPYTNHLQLWVDGAPVSWSGTTIDHKYTHHHTGDGSVVQFMIQDGGAVSDNSGSLTVKIYQQL